MYLLLKEEQYEKYKNKLEFLDWHCGITYHRKHTETFLDSEEQVTRAYYKIGCDSQHLNDDLSNHDFDYNMERIITIAKHLARQLTEGDEKSEELKETT